MVDTDRRRSFARSCERRSAASRHRDVTGTARYRRSLDQGTALVRGPMFESGQKQKAACFPTRRRCMRRRRHLPNLRARREDIAHGRAEPRTISSRCGARARSTAVLGPTQNCSPRRSRFDGGRRGNDPPRDRSMTTPCANAPIREDSSSTPGFWGAGVEEFIRWVTGSILTCVASTEARLHCQTVREGDEFSDVRVRQSRRGGVPDPDRIDVTRQHNHHVRVSAFGVRILSSALLLLDSISAGFRAIDRHAFRPGSSCRARSPRCACPLRPAPTPVHIDFLSGRGDVPQTRLNPRGRDRGGMRPRRKPLRNSRIRRRLFVAIRFPHHDGAEGPPSFSTRWDQWDSPVRHTSFPNALSG